MAPNNYCRDDQPRVAGSIEANGKTRAVPDALTIEVDQRIQGPLQAAMRPPDSIWSLLDLNMPGAHGFSGLVFHARQ